MMAKIIDSVLFNWVWTKVSRRVWNCAWLLIGAFPCLPTSWAQNVGIGTTNPQSRLHIVAPSGYSFPLLRVETDGSISPYLVVLSDGRVGISEANPDASAIVEVSDTTRGVLLPRMNEANKVNISNPATGLLVYQTTVPQDGFWFYDGTRWRYMLTDRDMLWKHSGDSLFSLPDTAIVVRGVGSPIPGGASDARVLTINSRNTGFAIGISPRTVYQPFPSQEINIYAPPGVDTVVQLIDFSLGIPGGFSGRIIYNQHYSWGMRKGFIFYTNGAERFAIDSLGRVGVRTPPSPNAWQHINEQPSLYVNDRIVARGVPGYSSDGSELPYLPYHNPCVINLHDTTVDIGDTLRFWLRRCKSVRLVLDSGKVYKWRSPVEVERFQSLSIMANINVYRGISDSSAVTILVLRNDTIVIGGSIYYVPTILILRDHASFYSSKIFYKFVKTTTLPLSTGCIDQGIIATGYASAFSKILIHEGKYEGQEASFIKVGSDSWTRIVLGAFVIRNIGPTTIYPVRVSGGICHRANGAIVGRDRIILGTNVQWETDPRIIYNQ
ncbi:MAG: hypothetical protein GXO48_06040 [Chlorobi bacterium]|nr:hypothetical protein [Chlorobiota bacterium]